LNSYYEVNLKRSRLKKIKKELQIDAIKSIKPMQPENVVKTQSDTSNLQNSIGVSPSTNVNNGIKKLIECFRSYYQNKL